MLGLKHGTVMLYTHEKEWETEAQNTILRLKQILGNAVKTTACRKYGNSVHQSQTDY